MFIKKYTQSTGNGHFVGVAISYIPDITITSGGTMSAQNSATAQEEAEKEKIEHKDAA